jgi:hypothetical protein
MIKLKVADINSFQETLKSEFKDNIQCENLEEKVRLLIFRDLFRLNWTADFSNDCIQVSPP